MRVALLLTFCIMIANLHSAEIIAHRGASYDAPENTLAAMKLAWEQKADAIELDLWLSKDGKIVVIHDDRTKRVSREDFSVDEKTLAQLQTVDVGTWKNSRFAGERIPTLDAILATVPKGKRAILEIKCGPEILPELSRVIQKSSRAPAELAIICFDAVTLKRSKRELPQIEHYLLFGYDKDESGKFPQLKDLIAMAKATKADGLDLQFKFPIDAAFVSEVKKAGLKLVAWTVNDAAVAKRLVAAGVDGITTDRPGWLREQLK